MTLYYEAVEVGQLLPTYERRTDLMNWNRFAAVNDEFVHVHMDDEAAKARGEKGVLGMGNLRFAYMHCLLRIWMGDDGLVRRLSIQHRGINFKNDTLTTKGQAMDVFSVIILGIAAIGILNLLLMAVYERTREIGVLGALGLKPRQISLLFILEGTMIGLVGVVLGIVLGLALNGVQKLVGLDFTAFSGMSSYTALITDRIYPSWGVSKLLRRGLTVAIIAALAAVIPAREAAQRDPAEALHYV